MSKTDKTDPYWVKVLHAKHRDEWHGLRCTPDTCDIESSLAPWRSPRPGTRTEVRTYIRVVTVPNPDYDPTITDWYDDNRWRATIEVERTRTYRISLYDGPCCSYRLTGKDDKTAYGRQCSCCRPDPAGKAHSRATERTTLNDLRRLYNAGEDVDDYLFDTDCPWGGKGW